MAQHIGGVSALELEFLTMRPARFERGSAAGMRFPLCVDLEHALVRGNLGLEVLLNVIKSHPWQIPVLLWLWLFDTATFRRRVAELTSLDPSRVLYRSDVLDWLSSDASEGRDLILVARCDPLIANKVAEYLGIFSEVLTDDSGSARWCLRSPEPAKRFGESEFDYVGSAAGSLSALRTAHAVSLVDTSQREQNALPESVKIVQSFAVRDWQVRQVFKAIRVRQWAKNALVFVPLLAAHKFLDLGSVIAAAIAFFSFSFCASATYVVNDLLDLECDRKHQTKRERPFASGALSAGSGLVLIPGLLALSFGLATFLPAMSILLLSSYLALTLGYSFVLKQKPLIDVFALSTLYTLRVLMGGAAIQVACSAWLIGFSLFLFLSLAFAKRCSELFNLRKRHLEQAAGRGYFVWDLTTLNAAGIASAYTAGIVLAEYIHSEEVRRFYRHPSLLWLLVPILLYWMSRLWLIANRGALNEDPLVFATRDRLVYILALVTVVILVFATIGNFSIPGVIE